MYHNLQQKCQICGIVCAIFAADWVAFIFISALLCDWVIFLMFGELFFGFLHSARRFDLQMPFLMSQTTQLPKCYNKRSKWLTVDLYRNVYFKRNIRNDSIRIWPSGARHPLSPALANTQFVLWLTHAQTCFKTLWRFHHISNMISFCSQKINICWMKTSTLRNLALCAAENILLQFNANLLIPNV